MASSAVHEHRSTAQEPELDLAPAPGSSDWLRDRTGIATGFAILPDCADVAKGQTDFVLGVEPVGGDEVLFEQHGKLLWRGSVSSGPVLNRGCRVAPDT